MPQRYKTELIKIKSQVRYKTVWSPLNLLLFTVESKKKPLEWCDQKTRIDRCRVTESAVRQMIYKGMSYDILIRYYDVTSVPDPDSVGVQNCYDVGTRSSNVFDLFGKQHDDDVYFLFRGR